MRINNKRIGLAVNLVYTILLLGLLCSLMLMLVPVHFIVKVAPPIVYFGVFVCLVLLFNKIGPHQFEYSSEGEVINIRTKDPFWIKYFPNSQTIIDFPKRKLIDFEIKGGIQKRLILHIKSKRSKKEPVKLKFKISFLSSKEILDLNKSLTKIIKNNQKIQLEEANKQ